MIGRTWHLDTFDGESLRLTVAPSESPEAPDEVELERLIGALVFSLDDRRRRELEVVYRELTGRSVPHAYSPFEPSGESWRRDVFRTLALAASSGQLRIEAVARPRVTVRREQPVAAPSMQPRQPEVPPEVLSSFEVRLVDEIGEPLSGVELAFSSGTTKNTQKTDGDGVARFKAVDASFGSVRVVDANSLAKTLDERWAKPRTGTLADAPLMRRLAFNGDLPSFQLESDARHTIVFQPELGKLLVELWDKRGKHRHADTAYTIQGPANFEGKTDADGRLLHENVPPGDYTLTLTQTFPEELKLSPETYQAPLVVLAAADGNPQVRLLGAVPSCTMARMRGMVFDTNKTFLLPTALPGLLKIRELYEQNNPSQLLIVGHTDTTAEPSVNDPLSLDRAKSVQQYLMDDVDGWLANYGDGVPQKKRWGAREDRLMMIKLDGFAARPPEQDSVTWFQEHHNELVKAGKKAGRSELEVDGKIGSKTRTELIFEYMSLDGASLKEQSDFLIDIKTHGCGENFPLDQTSFELDQRAVAERNDEDDRSDRRVELFFFDSEYGATPAPTSAKGKEYLTWRTLSVEDEDISVGAVKNQATLLELQDTLFRTNSAVVLPESEAPSAERQAPTGVGVIAHALRFNQDFPGRKLLIAGHTDTTADDAFNQKLSEERAAVALSLLLGDRQKFVELVNARHTVSDYKQILAWCSDALAQFFDCDPGKIDDNAATGVAPLKRFQTEYNLHKKELGAAAQPDLKPDGAIGPKTWGGIFDVYQFAIRDELGEDEAGVVSLRQGITFLDAGSPSMGFGEKHPIENAGKDNYRSQANRRVELLFFEAGQEPDPTILKEAPELTELYLPGGYERTNVEPPASVKRWFAEWETPTSRFGQSGRMRLRAPGLPAGQPMVFRVRSPSVDGFEAQVSAASQAGGMSVEFGAWDLAIPAETVELQAGERFPKVEFEFSVEGAGRSVSTTELLTYEDAVRLTLTSDPEDSPIANEDYLLGTPWGVRHGRTNGEGVLEETGLPPGGVSIALRERNLIHLGELDFGWNFDD